MLRMAAVLHPNQPLVGQPLYSRLKWISPAHSMPEQSFEFATRTNTRIFDKLFMTIIEKGGQRIFSRFQRIINNICVITESEDSFSLQPTFNGDVAMSNQTSNPALQHSATDQIATCKQSEAPKLTAADKLEMIENCNWSNWFLIVVSLMRLSWSWRTTLWLIMPLLNEPAHPNFAPSGKRTRRCYLNGLRHQFSNIIVYPEPDGTASELPMCCDLPIQILSISDTPSGRSCATSHPFPARKWHLENWSHHY